MTLRDIYIYMYGTQFVTKAPAHPCFFAALFTIAKLWKKPIGPTTGEWTMKMWYLCTMKLYSATKK
jgi:hypothetical protein